jgi:hypothetical protein
MVLVKVVLISLMNMGLVTAQQAWTTATHTDGKILVKKEKQVSFYLKYCDYRSL